MLGGGSETLELVSVEELDSLLAQGAELIDVREKNERDTGYIAGSRNIPYRMLALGAADLPSDRPIVTICETLATESLGRPDVLAGMSTLPGASTSRRFDVSTTATTVRIRLRLNASSWTIKSGRRSPGSEPRGSSRSAHQI